MNHGIVKSRRGAAGGITLNKAITLQGRGAGQGGSLRSVSGDSRLAFDLSGNLSATQINVTGDLLGSDTYVIDFYNGGGLVEGIYTLMTVSGAYTAESFLLGHLATGFEGSSLVSC